LLLLVDAASVGDAVINPDERMIVHTAGTQKVSLWYVTAHVSSDVQALRMRVCRSYKHEVSVCRFWEAGKTGRILELALVSLSELRLEQGIGRQ